jgi:hypothetical protein
MYHSYRYTCNLCGDERDLCSNSDIAGKCHSCYNGQYQKTGESYDQEYIEQIQYEEQQDREYEERHRYDRY